MSAHAKISNAPGRKVFTTPGGIHPPENKTQSLQKSIQQAPIANILTYPLSQHIGAPASPIVEVGDKVLKGQQIAKANGFVSVPVHASTSGTVIAIENRLIVHSSGMSAPSIVIESDGKDTWCELTPTPDFKQLEKSALVNIIREAGIAGMGGAGFPTAVKLSTRDDTTIESLIINGTECEPYITADDILMRERAEQIIAGVEILQYLINPTKETVIGVEDNKPEAIESLRKAAEGSNIEVVAFPTKYPSGGEKQLIQIITGKEVPSGKLPADIAVVCQNIGSTVAIYKAVTLGEPLISRITTVTGEAVDPQNFEVLLGTPMSFLLDQANYQSHNAARLIAGGPMMGFAIESTDVPIVKTSNCILVPSPKEAPDPPPAQACIRCGMCAEACPVSLLPQQMYWFAQAKDHEGLKNQHLMDCIECGACSYSCPSNIPLVQYYRASKADIRQAEADQKKAEYSKERFEAREARLAAIEAEKEAKRKARQEKAAKAAEAKAKAAESSAAETPKKAAPIAAVNNNTIDMSDPVQAAIAKAQAKVSGASVTDPAADATKKLEGLKKRLVKAEDKLNAAKASDDSNLAAFESSVTKLKEKIVAAENALPAASENTSPATPLQSESLDPVQAAIARAQAKRDGNVSEENPQEKLSNDIEKLKKRLSASEEKLKAAEAEGSDKVEAFQASVQKISEKLVKAQTELSSLTGESASNEKNKAPANNTEAPASAINMDDPVQAAIARAQAKRAGNDDTDPKTKLENDIANMQKRIAKAEQKLIKAKDENADTVDILETSLQKLNDKLAKAQQELSTL